MSPVLHSDVVGDRGFLYTLDNPYAAPRCIIGQHVAGASGISYCALATQECIMDILYDLEPTLFEETEEIEIAAMNLLVTHLEPSHPPALNVFPLLDELDRADDYPVVTTQSTRYVPSKTQDTLSGYYASHVPKIEPIFTDLALQEPDKTSEMMYMPPSGEYLGYLPASIPYHMSRESKLVPSSLSPYMVDKVTVAPARMKPFFNGDSHIDPLVEGLKRQVTLPYEEIDAVKMQACANATLKSVLRNPNRGVWTIGKALCGSGAVKPLEPNASAGHYFNNIATSKKMKAMKGSFFTTDTTKPKHSYTLDADVRSMVERCLDTLCRGNVPDWYTTVQLKDETVSLEKAEIGKTRLYYCADLANTIVCRMLFGDLVGDLLVSHLKFPGQASCAVGFNANTPHPNLIYANMQHCDVFAMDQKGWDNHQHWAFAKFLANAINDYYPHKEDVKWKIARETYLYSCYHTIYLCNRHFYRMEFGMPSGIWITSQLNSMYLEMMTLYAIHSSLVKRSLTGDFKLNPVPSPMDLKQIIHAYYYGDDSLVMIHPSYGVRSAHLFPEFKSLGLEATHCLKGLPIDQELPKDKVTFLKRYFIINPDGVFAYALEKESIEQMFSFMPANKNGDKTHWRAVAQSYLSESARWGTEYFEAAFKRVTDAFSAFDYDGHLSGEMRVYMTTNA